MGIFQAFILGLIQGLTEFFPVSSTGHLQLAGRLLGVDVESGAMLFYDTLLHVATLVAVIFVFLPDIIKVFKGMGEVFSGRVSLRRSIEPGGPNRVLFGLVIATLPALVMALILGNRLKNFLPGRYLAFGFWVTAVVLCLGELLSANVRARRVREPTPLDALFVGCAQALALLPGISRSGMTITAGKTMGFTQSFAAKFSFLLSAIAILGGALVQLPGVAKNGFGGIGWAAALVGMVTAAASGVFAIMVMLKMMQKNKMMFFAAYCAILGVVVFWGII